MKKLYLAGALMLTAYASFSQLCSVQITSTNATCFGTCDGSATANPVGVPPYNYLWTPGNFTTQTITGLCDGTYSVTVVDNNNCVASNTVTITEPTDITTSTTQVDVSCPGGSDGSISAFPSGGTPGYTYSWSTTPAQTTATASGLPAGSYTVYVTDNNSCSDSAVATLTQPSPILGMLTSVNVTCNGDCDGILSANPTGGTGPYTYLWSTSSTNDSIMGLCPDTFSVIITDANGCTQGDTGIVTEPAVLSFTTSQVNVLCFGQCNGTATAIPAGGTAPYTYTWTPITFTTATATGLCPGTYSVMVADANGCTTANQTVSITQPPALAATSTSVNPTCNGSQNGSATTTANGGSGNYTYTWVPSGGSGATATGLGAGSYTCIVTDANGCTVTTTVTLTQPPAITINITHNNASCFGCTDGSATASASGGSGGPYTYSWSNGATTASITGLGGGSYTVTVTDASGCTNTNTVFIVEPNGINDLPLADLFTLYPNPTSGEFTLAFNITTSMDLFIVITDVVGKQLSSGKYTAGSGWIREFSIADQPDGIYFLNLRVNGQSHTFKLVKM